LKNVLEEDKHAAIIELKAYLISSFGNATRIDYGSGHEMNFAAFLCCMDLIGAFDDMQMDTSAIVLKVFYRYAHENAACISI
jgi:serine/threonine-protein phosphatase 2A activator